MNGIEDLAAFISGKRPANIASPVLRKLRLHVADTIGAWVAGMATAEGRALIAFRHELSRYGTSRDQGGLFDDVALHCALARLSEVDDIHLASMITPGSIVIPTALTIAETLPNAEASDIRYAILGGYEAMIRLGAAIKGPSVLQRGIWPTYFTTPFAVAAVAARLLRLDDSQTAHALALAVISASPAVGQHHAETTSRWLSIGNAARSGMTAAFAARAGFTSDINILQSRLLHDVYGIDPDLQRMANNSGAPAFMQVSFKAWCGARQTMAATQALRELLDSGVAVEAITAIEVSVLPPHLKMIDHGVKAGDRASHLTSLPYQMAVAALQPEAQLDVSQSPPAVAEALKVFMSRIRIAGDEALLAEYPDLWPARVVVSTASGRHERRVDHVPGDPAQPLTEATLIRKFHRLAVPVLGEASAERLLQFALAAFQCEGSAAFIIQEVNRFASSFGKETQ